MAKFKPGPTKTRSGSDAVIFEVSDKIYGKVNSRGYEWELSGSFTTENRESILDLLPNVEPFRFEAKVCWARRDENVVPLWTVGDKYWELLHRKGTLTFVEDEE